jgi:hypothetical protein
MSQRPVGRFFAAAAVAAALALPAPAHAAPGTAWQRLARFWEKPLREASEWAGGLLKAGPASDPNGATVTAGRPPCEINCEAGPAADPNG